MRLTLYQNRSTVGEKCYESREERLYVIRSDDHEMQWGIETTDRVDAKLRRGGGVSTKIMKNPRKSLMWS
jgi:hypothetical protein